MSLSYQINVLKINIILDSKHKYYLINQFLSRSFLSYKFKIKAYNQNADFEA